MKRILALLATLSLTVMPLVARADIGTISDSGSFTGQSQSRLLPLYSETSCSVTVSGSGSGFTIIPEYSPDGGATLLPASLIGGGVITANGTYSGAVPILPSAITTSFSLVQKTPMSGTESYSVTCSAPPLAIAYGGTGSTALNFVDLTSAQTIGGAKTFTAPLTVSGMIFTATPTLSNDNFVIGSAANTMTGANNIGLGIGALLNITTGFANVAIGNAALSTGTTTNDSTAIGYNALQNLTGYEDTAVGELALQSDTTAIGNVAVGGNAEQSDTTGYDNTALGFTAGMFNVVGNANTALGYGTLYENTASYNTAVGYQALHFLTTGSDNTATGYQALLNATADNNQVADGLEALYNDLTGYNDTAIGFQSLYTGTDLSDNVAVGYESLFSATGSPNTAIGFQALYADSAGTGNTALGFQSLSGVTTGLNNSALGAGAGNLITSGQSNIAIGYGAQVVTPTNNGQLSIANAIYGLNNTGTTTALSTGCIAFYATTCTNGTIYSAVPFEIGSSTYGPTSAHVNGVMSDMGETSIANFGAGGVNAGIAAVLAGGTNGVGIGWNATNGSGEADIVTGYNGPTTANFIHWNGTAYVSSAQIGSDGTYEAGSSTYGPTSATIAGAISQPAYAQHGTVALTTPATCTALTACGTATVTFTTAMTAAPECIVTPATYAGFAYSSTAPTTTSVTFTYVTLAAVSAAETVPLSFDCKV